MDPENLNHGLPELSEAWLLDSLKPKSLHSSRKPSLAASVMSMSLVIELQGCVLQQGTRMNKGVRKQEKPDDHESVMPISLVVIERKGFLCPNSRNLRHSSACSCLWPSSKRWRAAYHLSLSVRRPTATHAVLYQACTFKLVAVY